MTNLDARSERLNMRVSVDAQNTLRRAANACQQDLSAFVLGAALEKARRIMLEQRVLTLSPQDLLHLERALDEPASESAELRRLFLSVGKVAKP